MKSPDERQAAPEIVDVLADLLGTPPGAVGLIAEPREGVDFCIKALGFTFLAEYKKLATPGPLANAVQQLKRAAESHPGSIPLLVVPYLSPRGRELCQQSGVCWVDLCGNARIDGRGLRVWIEGRPNRFVERGRPSSAFAPKAARVTRQLLAAPAEFQSQTDLARRSRLGNGFVSKIVARLVAEDYVVKNDVRAVRPRDPGVLLEGWRDVYDFNRNRILIGRIPAGRGDEVLHRTAAQLSRAQIDYTVTGVSGAWLWTKFAPFELTTVYVRSMPSRAFLKKIDFAEQPQDGNIWFVVPSDDGVYEGSEQRDGVPCASPLQIYLDLKGQPGRAAEAAVELRKNFLTWRRRGK